MFYAQDFETSSILYEGKYQNKVIIHSFFWHEWRTKDLIWSQTVSQDMKKIQNIVLPINKNQLGTKWLRVFTNAEEDLTKQ